VAIELLGPADILDPEDEAFMIVALQQALLSPDPSTQNGAILVRDDIVGRGYNCFPDGVEYLPERWKRPIKYSYIEHAERNAIFNAARCGSCAAGTTLYCTWFACADCARAIIQAGVVRVVGVAKHASHGQWNESISIGDIMMAEAGIEVVRGLLSVEYGIELRRNYETITF